MKYLILIILFFVFCGVVFFSTAGGVWVHSDDDLQHISCGWPLKFGFSDQSWRDPTYPSGQYPVKLSCLSTWGDGEIWWPAFFANVSIFYLVFLAALSIPINPSPEQTLLENLTKQTILGRIFLYANKKRKIILITLAVLFGVFVLYLLSVYIMVRVTTPTIHHIDIENPDIEDLKRYFDAQIITTPN